MKDNHCPIDNAEINSEKEYLDDIEPITEEPEDEELRARMLELQLQLEAELEASGRLSAEDAEALRQEEEERLSLACAREVIQDYNARRRVLSSAAIRNWRDGLYDDYTPPVESFWDRYGNTILTVLFFLLSLSMVVFLIHYSLSTQT